MKPRTIFYNIGQGFKGVFRHRVMTTASMLVLIACMILVGTFYLVIDTIDRNFNAIDNLNVIEIMLDKDYQEPQIKEIADKLAQICNDSPIIDWTKAEWVDGETIPQYDNFKYISADEHLKMMAEMYPDEDWFKDILEYDSHYGNQGDAGDFNDTVQDNPLRASFRITFINLSDFDEVTKVKNQIDEITIVKVNQTTDPITMETIETKIEQDAVKTEDIKDNIELYGNVMDIKNTLYLAGLWLLGIFLLIALFVIMNTIKLGVAARENEIKFMRLVGATKSFIRMPFMVEGAIIGLFSAAISYGIQYYLYEYLFKDIISSATGTTGGIISAPFSEYALIVALGFVAIGLFAGIVASGISMRKYLKA